MLSTFVTHLIAFSLGGAAGAWLHYRYGSSVKNAIATIETRVQDAEKKL